MVLTLKKLSDTRCFAVSRIVMFVGAFLSLCTVFDSLTGTAASPVIFIIAALILTVLAVFAYKKMSLLYVNSVRQFFVAFSAVLCTFSLLFFTDSSKSLIWIIAFVCIAYFFRGCFELEITEKLSTLCFVLSVFFSLLIFLGSQLAEYERLEFLYLPYKSMQQIFLPFSRLSYLIFLIYVLLAKILSSALNMKGRPLLCEAEGKTNYTLLFLACMAIIIICWLPYFIAFYPGVISEDSLSEILQQLGREPLSNHHPIIHQFFIGLCLKAADTLTSGVGIFSIVQMLFLASAFSAVIVFLKKQGVKRFALCAVLAVYALYPVNAFFSITMWKDVPFAATSVFLCILLLNETDEKGKRGFLRALLFVAAAFGFCTFRNNGFYAFVFGMVLIILFNRTNRKRLALLTVITVCAVLGYQHILFDTLGFEKSNISEALSVPIQQVARVVNIDGIDDGDENITVLREVFPDLEQTAENYNPTFADPVKGNPKRGYALFDAEVFSNDPVRYIKSWVGLGLEHPVNYIEAFLLQSYGYWYPDINVNIVGSYIIDNDLGLKSTESFEALKLALFLNSEAFIRHQPTAILGSIGFLVWVLFICAVLLCLKGHGHTASVLFCMLGLWLTTLLSPVYCEYRYIYGLIAVVPLFAALTYSKENIRGSF